MLDRRGNLYRSFSLSNDICQSIYILDQILILFCFSPRFLSSWLVNHFSPVHHHNNSASWFKVIDGELQVTLMDKATNKPIKKSTLLQNSVTYFEGNITFILSTCIRSFPFWSAFYIPEYISYFYRNIRPPYYWQSKQDSYSHLPSSIFSTLRRMLSFCWDKYHSSCILLLRGL